MTVDVGGKHILSAAEADNKNIGVFSDLIVKRFDEIIDYPDLGNIAVKSVHG